MLPMYVIFLCAYICINKYTGGEGAVADAVAAVARW